MRVGVGIKMSWVEKTENLIRGEGGTSTRYWRVGTKFRLKRLNFWIKLTQKGYFRPKKNENYL